MQSPIDEASENGCQRNFAKYSYRIHSRDNVPLNQLCSQCSEINGREFALNWRVAISLAEKVRPRQPGNLRKIEISKRARFKKINSKSECSLCGSYRVESILIENLLGRQGRIVCFSVNACFVWRLKILLSFCFFIHFESSSDPDCRRS